MRELPIIEPRREVTAVERLARLSNKEWGNLTGCAVGLGVGLWAIFDYGIFDTPSFALTTFLRCAAIPGFMGSFGTFFANIGAAIDIPTDKKTFLTWAVRKYYERLQSQQPVRINRPLRLVSRSSEEITYTDSNFSGGMSEPASLHYTSSSVSEDQRDDSHGYRPPHQTGQEDPVPDDRDIEMGLPKQVRRTGYQPIK